MSKKSGLFKKIIKHSITTSSYLALTLNALDAMAGAVQAGVIAVNNGAISSDANAQVWKTIKADGTFGEYSVGPERDQSYSHDGDYTISADRNAAIIGAINANGHAGTIIMENMVEDEQDPTYHMTIGSIVNTTQGQGIFKIIYNEVDENGNGCTLNLNGASATAENNGFDAGDNQYTGLTEVDFIQVGTLNFNGTIKKDDEDKDIPTVFSSTVTNAANATLEVSTYLLASDPSVTGIKNIQINDNMTLVLGVDAAALGIMTQAGQNIEFLGAGANLILQPPEEAQTVTFNNIVN